MGKLKLKKTELKTLNLHFTNRCNMRCRHCLYSAGERKIKEMNFQGIKKLIKEFADISDKQGVFNMFGGEIFLRKDIFDIIDYAILLGLAIGITTNANLSIETIKKIIKSVIFVFMVIKNTSGADYLLECDNYYRKIKLEYQDNWHSEVKDPVSYLIGKQGLVYSITLFLPEK